MAATTVVKLNRIFGFVTFLLGALALTGLVGCSSKEDSRSQASKAKNSSFKTDLDCSQPSQIKLVRASGETAIHTTIQAAIDQATSGDQIDSRR